MARTAKPSAAKSNGANLGFESQPWQAAAALGNNMDAAEYKHVVLGLIFLRYISDAFEEKHQQLEEEKAQGGGPRFPCQRFALSITLLPKLMSGELRVKGAERLVAEVLS